MKDPLHGLRLVIAATPRVMGIATCTVLGLPLALTVLALYVLQDTGLLDFLSWTCVVGGTLSGIIAIVMSVIVFVRRSSARGVAILSFAAGLLGIPWAVICGAVIALSQWHK